MRRLIKRLLHEDDGMELLEWSIVAVLFALAGAAAMASLGTGLRIDVNLVTALLSSGGS